MKFLVYPKIGDEAMKPALFSQSLRFSVVIICLMAMIIIVGNATASSTVVTRCETTAPWITGGGALTANLGEAQEGTNCMEFVSSGSGFMSYNTYYDWSGAHYAIFYAKTDNITNPTVTFYLADNSGGDTLAWNFTVPNNWTTIAIDLSTTPWVQSGSEATFDDTNARMGFLGIGFTESFYVDYIIMTTEYDDQSPITNKTLTGPIWTICEGASSTLLSENFIGSFPPTGWTTDNFDQSNTAHAGGEAPEARLDRYSRSGSIDYLMTPIFDTSGTTSLTLQFRDYKDVYYSGSTGPRNFYVKVYDGSTWVDVTPWTNPLGDQGAAFHTVDLSSYTSTQTQIRFEYGSTWSYLNNWYIDNVTLCGNVNDVLSVTSDTQICFHSIDNITGAANLYIEVMWDSDGDGVVDTLINDTVIRDNGPDDLLDTVAGEIRYCMNLTEECFHEVRYYSIDHFGNIEEEHLEIDMVDNTSPITIKEYGSPFYVGAIVNWSVADAGDVNHYITSNTLIYLNTTDYPVSCASGVNRTEYKVHRWNGSAFVLVQGWTVYTDPFNFSSIGDTHECLHRIKVRSFDNLGHNESEWSQYVMVDNTPPESGKVIGTPQGINDSYVTTSTPIWLNASNDNGVRRCQVDSYLYYEVWWDSDGDGVVDVVVENGTVVDNDGNDTNLTRGGILF